MIIRNKTTGETRTIDPSQASTYGLDTSGIKPQDMTSPSEGAFTSAVKKTGLYDIPVLGGLIRGVSQPLLKAGEAVAETGYQIPQTLKMILDPQHSDFKTQPKFVSQDFFNKVMGPKATLPSAALEGTKTGIGAAANVGALAGVPGVAMGAGIGAGYGFSQNPSEDPLSLGVTTVLGGGTGAALSWLTPKVVDSLQTAGQMLRHPTWQGQQSVQQDAIDAATQGGWQRFYDSEFSDKALNNLTTKYGEGSPQVTAAEKILKLRSPGKGDLAKDANWYLTLRDQLTATYKNKLFQQTNIPEYQAATEIRNTISQMFHDPESGIAGTISPDKIMTIWTKYLGKDAVGALVKALGKGTVLLLAGKSLSDMLGRSLGGAVTTATQ